MDAIELDTTRKPNLFVIGAMKSGSTTVHEYLQLHRDIYMSGEKEPGYFVPELWGRRPESDYTALFAQAGSERYVGESSTHYTKLPRYTGVAEKIAAYAPGARFIYIMRHPVERAISHYYHAVRDVRMSGETRDILSAISANQDYFAFSDYQRQLKPYFQLFGKDKILTLVFEEFKSDPATSLTRICDWLELPHFSSPLPTIAANRAPEEYQKASGRGFLNRIRNSRTYDLVAPLVPTALRQRAAAASVTTTTQSISDDERRAVYRYLAAPANDSIRALSQLTGRDYALWELDEPD
jgi:hypothetical protein